MPTRPPTTDEVVWAMIAIHDGDEDTRGRAAAIIEADRKAKQNRGEIPPRVLSCRRPSGRVDP